MIVAAAFAGGLAIGSLVMRTPRGHRVAGVEVPREKGASRQGAGETASSGATRQPGPAAEAALSNGEETDLASALHKAAGERDYGRRRFETYQVALQLDEQGLAEALALTAAMPVGQRFWVQPTLIARWLELSPEAAVAWVRGLPPGKGRTELLGETFQALGLKDPQIALRLLA